MDRESFLNRATAAPKTTEIPLDDGQVLKARKLSQAEVEHIRRNFATDAKALEGYRYIVSRAVLTDAGERMFTDADAAQLTGIDFDTIQTIATEVIRFSGLGAAKNA